LLTLSLTLAFLVADGLCNRLRPLTLCALTLLRTLSLTLAFLFAEGLCRRLLSLTLCALTLLRTLSLTLSLALALLDLLLLLPSICNNLCHHPLESCPYVAYTLPMWKWMI